MDTMSSQSAEELSTALQKSSEFKRIPLIETSAHRNINVEQTFISLFRLIDKQRCIRANIPRYVDALRLREDELQGVYGNFLRLLSHSHPDFLGSWSKFMKRYSQQSDVVAHIEKFGTEIAKIDFERFVKHREFVFRRNTFERITKTLSSLLPNLDPVRNKSIEEVVQYIRDRENFSVHFVDDLSDRSCTSDAPNSTDHRKHSKTADTRIPFRLLTETCINHTFASPLQNYINRLSSLELKYSEQARTEALFYALLPGMMGPTGQTTEAKASSGFILPSQPFSDLQWPLEFLKPTELSDEELHVVYKRFQNCLRIQAREDFLDLLLEHTDLFVQAAREYLCRLYGSIPGIRALPETAQCPTFVEGHSRINSADFNHASSSASTSSSSTGIWLPSTDVGSDSLNRISLFATPPRGAIENHLNWLDIQLASDWRHRAMSYLPSERQTLMASHFSLLIPSSPCTSLQSSRCPLFEHTTCQCSVPHMQTGNCNAHVPTSSCRSDVSHSRSVDTSFLHSGHRDPVLHCPALSWGGCMDLLFKQLAYRLFPVNPTCLEPVVISHPRTDRNTTDLLHPSTDSSSHIRTSCPCFCGHNPSTLIQEYQLPTPQLLISVVCICSDVLASHAAVHLLACAGFSLTSLLSSPSEGTRSVSFDAISGGVDSGSDCPTHPLLVSASWPLSSGRIPLMRSRRENFIGPTTTDATSVQVIPSGQVRAAFMSLHKTLRTLLANTWDSTAGGTKLDNATNNVHNPKDDEYHGYIFVLGAPHAEETRDTCVNPLSPSPKDLVVIGCPTHSGFQSRHIAEEADENLLTPRPRSDPMFFTGDGNASVADSIKTTSTVSCVPQQHSVHSCNCCSLFGLCKPQLFGSSHCSCGVCCDCLSAGFGAHKASSSPIEPGCSLNGDSLRTTIPYRPRDWSSRLSALRTVISLLPKNCPHLVLLANNDGKVEHTMPRIVPASDSLYMSGSYCSHNKQSKSDASATFVTGKPTNGPSEDEAACQFCNSTSDILPGLNILDNLIAFLERCWEYAALSKSCPSTNLCCANIYLPHNQMTYNCQCKTLSMLSNSGSVKPSCLYHKSPSVVTAAASEKSIGPSLFHAASATGRRAMHSANLVFKKWSSNARRRQNSGSISTTCTAAVPFTKAQSNVLPDSHNKPVVLFSQASSSSLISTRLTSFPTLSGGSCSPSTVLNTLHPSFPSQIDATSAQPNIIDSSRASEGSYSAYLKTTFNTLAEPHQLADSENHNSFRRSRLCASLDQPHSARRGLFSSVGRPTSRCSFPDCALLSSSDQTKLTRSHRTLSSQTLMSTANSHICKDRPFSILPATRDIAKNHTIFHRLAIPPNSPSILPSSSVGPDTSEQGSPFGPPSVIPSPQSDILTVPDCYDKRPKVDSSCPNSCVNPCPSIFECRNSNEDKGFSHNTISTAESSAASPNSSEQSYVQIADKDDESIYEDLDLLSVRQCPTDPSTPAPTVSNQAPDRPLLDYAFVEDVSVYSDPIDSLAPAYLERHWCAQPCPPLHFPNVSSHLSRSQEHAAEPSEAAVSHTGYWMNTVLRRCRERHRSFSTPEGSTTLAVDPESHYSLSEGVKTSDKLPVSSFHLHLSPDQRSSNESCAHHPADPCWSRSNVSHVTQSSQLCFGSQAPATSSGLYSTHFGSPASRVLSENALSGPAITEDDRINHIRPPLSTVRPQPISKFHHHHFWHHSDCPHFALHRPSSKAIVDCDIPTSIPKDAALARSPIEDDPRLTFRRHWKNHRPLSGGSVVETHVSMPWTSSSLTSLSPQFTKPMLIDPADFPSHHPHPVRSPIACHCSSTPTSTLHTHADTQTVQQKESKWSKRSRKLNIFGSYWHMPSGGFPNPSSCRGKAGSGTPTATNPSVTTCSPAQPASSLSSVNLSDSISKCEHAPKDCVSISKSSHSSASFIPPTNVLLDSRDS